MTTNDMRESARTIIPSIVFSVGLATILCLISSICTSPLCDGYGFDSAVFQVVGQGWANGKIPYLELWDHKGAYLYLINCLGFLIAKKSAGILLLQIISLTYFFFVSYKTYHLEFNTPIAMVLTVATGFWLACSYSGGNLPEEYCLPWIAGCVYFVSRYLKEHNPVDLYKLAFISGLTLGVSFLTRLTNGLSSCGIMFGVGLILLKKTVISICSDYRTLSFWSSN